MTKSEVFPRHLAWFPTQAERGPAKAGLGSQPQQGPQKAALGMMRRGLSHLFTYRFSTALNDFPCSVSPYLLCQVRQIKSGGLVPTESGKCWVVGRDGHWYHLCQHNTGLPPGPQHPALSSNVHVEREDGLHMGLGFWGTSGNSLVNYPLL